MDLPKKKIRVLVADDHEIVRYGLVQAIQEANDIDVVAEAGNGQEAILMFREHRPDVCLMDINMPGMGGVKATESIKNTDANARVLVLTMHLEDTIVKEALAAGANGYMLKNSHKNEIIEGIRKVYKGVMVMNDVVMRALEQSSNEKSSIRTNPNVEHDLTKREMEILKLIVEGKTSQQVADTLFISPRTVDTHRSNMMQKLKVNNTAALVRAAYDKGIVSY